MAKKSINSTIITVGAVGIAIYVAYKWMGGSKGQTQRASAAGTGYVAGDYPPDYYAPEQYGGATNDSSILSQILEALMRPGSGSKSGGSGSSGGGNSQSSKSGSAYSGGQYIQDAMTGYDLGDHETFSAEGQDMLDKGSDLSFLDQSILSSAPSGGWFSGNEYGAGTGVQSLDLTGFSQDIPGTYVTTSNNGSSNSYTAADSGPAIIAGDVNLETTSDPLEGISIDDSGGDGGGDDESGY
jgi:hypothetical protein